MRTLPKIAILTSLLLTLSAMSHAQDRTPAQPPLVTVNGNGVVRIDPDMATVRLGVEIQARTAQEAQNQTNAVSQRLMDAITKLGIDRKDVQTSAFQLFPLMSEPRPGQTTPPVVTAYRATNIVTVRVNDLKKVGPVIDATVAVGGNTIQGIDFGLRDDSAARRDALKRAVLEAKSKAEAIAEALGVKLGAIYEAQEGGVQVMPMMLGRAAMANASEAVVSPGQVDVSASVTLRFRIAS